MGYEIPIVCKELYLPCMTNDTGRYTLKDYEEKFGIDLRKYIILTEDGYIRLNWPLFTKVYLVETFENIKDGNSFLLSYPKVGELTKVVESLAYASGDSDAFTSIQYGDSEALIGMAFEIDADAEFNIENITIQSMQV